ncbi:MAG: hypothetical protein MZW92_48085 [Comamonadaceae bacterium]|nr:hypothetical protein [Comamonadaceae bacterium]
MSEVTAAIGPAAGRRERLGLLLGLIGVLAFSLTLPMTRLAVAELDAWFVGFGRMALAGLVVCTVARAGARATAAPRRPAVAAPAAWSAWWSASRCARRWRCARCRPATAR